MRKTYFTLLTLICLIFVTGCFNEEKGNTKKVGNATITNKADYLSVAFDKNVLGAELHINGKVDEDKIKTSGDVKKFVINRDGETIVLFAGNNIPAKGEAIKIFGADIASVTGANGVDTVNGGNGKKRAAATDAHVLLGDTDANDTVNISDFIKFAQSYGYAKGDAGYDIKCDIAPAEKGVIAGWEDIYAIATADSKVDIFDFIVFAQNYGKSKPTSQVVYTTQEKLQGYTFTNNAISFLFDTETFKSQLSVGAIVTNVNVAGSFNGWNATSADWKTVSNSSGTVFTIEKTNLNVTIPGNSGHPEFKFVVTTKEADGTSKSSQWMQPPTALEVGYKFFQKTNDYNTLVVFPTDNVAEIVADNKTAMTIKTTESEFTSVEDLSNFRAVNTGSLAENRLFRSYHPFIASRSTVTDLVEIEKIKISKVQALMESNSIKSVINLSDTTTDITSSASISPYYKKIYEDGNVLSYVTSYNVVYFESTGNDYAKLMKAVTGFVMTHDGPFMVHCRLGTDRTGVVTAFLEGIMGATWKEISDDYKRSNNQYFKEFRSERILKYSFEKLLNITLTDSTKIDTAIATYLKTNANILYTDDDIAKIKAKLGESVITDREKLQGAKATSTKVSFAYDTETFKSQLSSGAAITNVNVAGSFNGWNAASADWKMVKNYAGTVYTLTKVSADVKAPGNSGHPEFKFVVTTKEADGTTKTNWMQPPTALEVGYKFYQKTNDYNGLVIYPTDDLAEIVADNTTVMTIKTKESDFTSVEDLSNFRAVETGSLGEKRLFRGYHPFIASRATDVDLKDIEAIKIKKVQELMTANGIKSVINLSDMVGEITGNVGTFALYKDAYAANNVLSYVTSYNVVYYGSNGADFAKLMKNVTGFVMTHEGPFMVHCRLGTDRTGTVTAFLEGLMGATWKEISDDYKRSNNQYFKEFRSDKILKYSIERMLNITLTDSTKIDVEIANYLKTNPNILYTDDDIAKIKAKLSEPAMTDKEKLQGYRATLKKVSFAYDTETFKSQLSAGAVVTNVNVAGSFNGWASALADWKMVKNDLGTMFTLTRVSTDIKAPGNSGHPEFKFVVTTKEADGTTKTNWMQPPTALEVGYKFFQKTNDYNGLVIYPTDNLAEIVADNTTVMTVKTQESEFTSVEDLSNFRAVETGTLGAKKLFRSYHPFIASRATDVQLKDIEAIKIKKVQELMTTNGIKSVINLSDMVGEITGNVGTFTLYKDAYAANNVLSYVTSYNVVYYGSNGTDFAKLMKTVTGFVMTHDAPFMVHCRLGTDRTGAVTAFLEGIMGATWKEISDDYKRSNNQYFKEFRSERLLKYSIERMLNITLTDSTKIDVEIANYLKTNPNILYTDDDIAKIKAKLGK